ncbi:SUMF1/EgtB/PvdO family nonheme iron enzyme, partial [candidate division CSSED10-310 bacterium]
FAPLGVLGKTLVHELEGNTASEINELLRALRDYPDYDTLPLVIERFRIRAFVDLLTGEALLDLQEAVERVLCTPRAAGANPYPLKGLPVTGMSLSASVSDIAGLRGLELDHLDLSQTMVSDLTPLADVRVKTLIVPATVTDLGPLKDMTLDALDLSLSQVVDLGPLGTMSSLTTLIGPPTLEDIRPLADLPLENLDLSTSRVRDLSPVQDAPLQFLRLPVTVQRLSGLETGTLVFMQVPAGVTDLSSLRGMQLRGLDLRVSGVTDLEPLRGMALEYITLPPGICDISPLAGMPLRSLDLFHTDVSDLSPLSTLQDLERLNICPEVLRFGWQDVLKSLSGVEVLSADDWFTPLCPDDFWSLYRKLGPSATKNDYSLAGQARLEFSNSLGGRFRWVPPGVFLMGSPLSEVGRRGDEQLHYVALSHGFYCGVYSVTVGEFSRFASATGYRTVAEEEGWSYGLVDGDWDRLEGLSWKTPGFDQTDAHPVVCVSWYDVVAFCEWLSEREGVLYRLPTESEWEYACRSGTSGAFSGNLDKVGWYHSNSESRLHPVGEKRPNSFGLYDMHGNVYEWCGDFYGTYPVGYALNPYGSTSGLTRVRRGGSGDSTPRDCRSAGRGRADPGGRGTDGGFRLASVQSPKGHEPSQ